MKLTPMIRVQAQIELNDVEAEVLNHLASYGLAKWFAEHCSKKYTADEVSRTLDRVRTVTAQIVRARNEAINAIHKVAGSDQ
jgi:hypothetical protein